MPWIDWFVTEEGHHLPPKVSRAVVILGRLGFAARGMVYLSIGIFALLAVLGVPGAEPTDAAGAMAKLAEQPLGVGLVIAAGVGLAAYALWKVAQAVFDLEDHAGGWKGTAYRLLQLGDGLFHAGFAVFVFTSVGASPDDGEETRGWAAAALAVPAGVWLLMAVGAVTVLWAAWLLYRAWTHRFVERLSVEHHGVPPSLGVLSTARIGETARSIVFGLFGIFLLRAAILHDPDEARGLGEAFEALADTPLGGWLMLAAALGFVAYGIWGFVLAWWRDIGRGMKEEEPA